MLAIKSDLKEQFNFGGLIFSKVNILFWLTVCKRCRQMIESEKWKWNDSLGKVKVLFSEMKHLLVISLLKRFARDGDGLCLQRYGRVPSAGKPPHH